MTNRIFYAALAVFVFYFCLNPVAVVSQANKPDEAISQLADSFVEEKAAPGVIAAIARKDNPIRIGASGLRKSGDKTQITINDLVHLGSCTKAITATMIARMVERGELSWDTTIADGLPNLKNKIHADYHDVTLEQLLKHKSGVPANGPWFMKKGNTVTKKREAIVIETLGKKPKIQPGKKYLYSNLGYMIAGLIAAKKRKLTWEELVTREVFKPLGLATAGFGPPGIKGKVEQPWGHNQRPDKKFWPLQRDNAPPLGPAGTIHMSISDWAKFAMVHTAKTDSEFIKAASLEKLHDPDDDSRYALGWIVLNRPWGKGTVYSHSGSNTMWFATVWVAPETQTVYLAAANAAGEKTSKEVDSLIGKMIQLDRLD